MLDDVGAREVGRRAGDGDVHTGQRAGLEQRVGDVVAVADVGEAQAVELPEALLQGEQVGERLAWMVVVGQQVDDRDRRIDRQRLTSACLNVRTPIAAQ